jgi:hypothetical protein
MKRIKMIDAAASLLLALIISVSATGQAGRQAAKPGGTAGRAYTPRVLDYSASAIVEGRILSIKGGRIKIETARGAHYVFLIDEATSIFESGEAVSIASMADISLEPADLRAFDAVEIVVERASRPVARIITRLASGARFARR